MDDLDDLLAEYPNLHRDEATIELTAEGFESAKARAKAASGTSSAGS